MTPTTKKRNPVIEDVTGNPLEPMTRQGRPPNTGGESVCVCGLCCLVVCRDCVMCFVRLNEANRGSQSGGGQGNRWVDRRSVGRGGEGGSGGERDRRGGWHEGGGRGGGFHHSGGGGAMMGMGGGGRWGGAGFMPSMMGGYGGRDAPPWGGGGHMGYGYGGPGWGGPNMGMYGMGQPMVSVQ